MEFLVTGGAGFIGSHFVRYLLETTDHDVVTLDALTYAGSRDNLGDALGDQRHEFVQGDIRNNELVRDLVERVDIVVNFAAESHVDRSIDSSEQFVRTNVLGIQTLLDAARTVGVDRFVQISTDEVYGEAAEGKFSESDCLSPRNPYAATKAGADHLAEGYLTTYGLPVTIIRSTNSFGPNQHAEKLIPKFITRAAAGESLPVYGDGSNVREWTYVRDNCRAIYRIIGDGEAGETYNVGSGEELSTLEVTERIVDAVGASQDQIEFVTDRPGHDERYALDSRKVRALGWSPNWSFSEGLRDTVEYYL